MFIALLLGVTFVPPMLGLYSPTFSMLYDALPERGGSNPQSPQIGHTVAYIGGHVYSALTGEPAADVKVKIFGMDSGVIDIVYTNENGLFNSTIPYTTGQLFTLSFNETFSWSGFLPYNVEGYYDFGTIELPL